MKCRWEDTKYARHITWKIVPSSEVRNEWIYISTPPIRLHGVDMTTLHKENMILLVLITVCCELLSCVLIFSLFILFPLNMSEAV